MGIRPGVHPADVTYCRLGFIKAVGININASKKIGITLPGTTFKIKVAGCHVRFQYGTHFFQSAKIIIMQ